MTKRAKRRRERAPDAPATTAPTGDGSQGTKGASTPAVALFTAPPGAGGGELHKDAGLVVRAVKERWPTLPEKRATIRQQLEETISAFTLEERKTNPLYARLLAVVKDLEAQNQRDELGDIEPPEDQTADVRAAVDEMRSLAARLNANERIIEAGYAIIETGDGPVEPGDVRHAAIRGPVEGGPPS